MVFPIWVPSDFKLGSWRGYWTNAVLYHAAASREQLVQGIRLPVKKVCLLPVRSAYPKRDSKLLLSFQTIISSAQQETA